MNLGLTQRYEQSSVDLSTIIDDIHDLNMEDLRQEQALLRINSMVDSLESLSVEDRTVVMNYLRQDTTFATLTGSDASCYLETLKHNIQSTELAPIVGQAIGLGAVALGTLLHKFQYTFIALRKKLTDGKLPTDEDLNRTSADRRCLKPDAFMKNHTVLKAAYQAIKNVLVKEQPSAEDITKITTAMGIQLPAKRSAGEILKGAYWGSVIALVGEISFGALVASVYLSAPALALACHVTTLVGLWFTAWRTGSDVSNKKKGSMLGVGWRASTVENARKACLEELAWMDTLVTATKSAKIADPDAVRAMKTLMKLFVYAVQGQCISTSRLMQ